ncbi:MFS transporter [Erwinia mallotivora]|uniref:MFS transporter n=1 Tax=Erwinia mallotivora TaxID=69222 RepID=UPI0035EE1047
MFLRAGSLNPTIKIMLTGTFLSRIGYFMVWPFLSLYLHNTLHVSLFMVGAIFFVASLSGVAVSIFPGYHSDRSGRNPVICFGLLISIISFILMGAVASLTACIVAICFLSAGKPSSRNDHVCHGLYLFYLSAADDFWRRLAL